MTTSIPLPLALARAAYDGMAQSVCDAYDEGADPEMLDEMGKACEYLYNLRRDTWNSWQRVGGESNIFAWTGDMVILRTGEVPLDPAAEAALHTLDWDSIEPYHP